MVSYLCRSKKKKKKAQEKLEKFIVKPGEESTYHPVEEKKDYRTEAEKRFDEHLSQRVGFHNQFHSRKKILSKNVQK